MNNKELAQIIVKNLGGEGNIASLTNCITRLRINLKSRNNVNLEAIKGYDEVLSVIDQGTIQIVLGPGKVTKVANEIHETTRINVDVEGEDDDSEFDLAEDTKASYKAKQTSRFQQLFRHIGNIFVPIVPGLVASGLMLGIANLISNMANAGMIEEAVLESDWYMLLQSIGGLLFGSLGVFVGINTAREFGGTMVLGGIAGLLIYAPVLDDISTLSLFGLDLSISSGLGGLLGAIIAAYLFTKIEKFVRNRVHDSLDLILTPLITVMVGSLATIVVIQPIAGILMDGITWFLVDVMLEAGGIFGGFILSATFLPLVTVGMHQGLIPVHLELIEQFGSTTLLPILAMAGGGQVGAMIAIYLKTKSKRLKNTVASVTPVGFLGIGEPLIYGVTLPLGRPFITASLGAGFGGAFLSLFNVGAITVGPSGLVMIPLIADNNYLLYVIGLVISYIGGFTLTYLFGFKEEMVYKLYGETPAQNDTAQPKREAAAAKEDNDDTIIKSPLTGELHPLNELTDEVFANELVGRGIAIYPTEGKLYAPAAGTVSTVYPTGHAVGITTGNGAEILLHIGLDTVDIKEKVFDLHVAQDDEVKAGQLLCTFDIDAIKDKGYDIASPVVITNSNNYEAITPVTEKHVEAGGKLLEVK
ncbi:PTS system IIA component, Glc family /PTS system IIB component, Glc family /PTS system IIC component, Glc family [Lentibacillus persicus]|uniref:PTS system IIA component, Glc family /PTS system IIB component, Glc family /PTS system IIC component, Glc family n=1 Tax=Lentibacillus persicus TaxID=640948 RepID=A0A1I2A4L0_9BACI|nr:glucose PTS transporter subunit IIA [Lentibacillus persicus]SFE37700.1 PTS system IIA component, Glc family /PTS system IIB component, Glc family /PTS system IIC component, Glc family [Lentibacillus persicus]